MTEEEKELFDSEILDKPSGVKLPKNVQNCHEKDITKKPNRKNRFLFAFPGLVGIKNNSRLGIIENIDSPNPSIYLDFPEVGFRFECHISNFC